MNCSMCPRLPHRKPIPPVGPRPARIVLCGEAPSYDEDSQGEPFVGKTGFELTNTYLPILGIPRSELLICNARWCSEYNYANPTPEQALSCASLHLGPLLAEAQPEIVVPMGAVACSLFTGVNLNMDHGRARVGKWGSWCGCVFAMYHPSSGLHVSSMMIALAADFDNLRKFIKGLDEYKREYGGGT